MTYVWIIYKETYYNIHTPRNKFDVAEVTIELLLLFPNATV